MVKFKCGLDGKQISGGNKQGGEVILTFPVHTNTGPAWTVLQQKSLENDERFIHDLPWIDDFKHCISYLFIYKLQSYIGG